MNAICNIMPFLQFQATIVEKEDGNIIKK